MIEITNIQELRNIVFNKDFSNHIIILNFFASWCTSCTIITPELEKLENAYANRVLVIKIDVDRSRDIAQAFDIQSIPCGIFYYRNKMFNELTLVAKPPGNYYQNVNVLLSQYSV